MPNLDYDPQNPSDLLGQPIAVGDIVARACLAGRSAALALARVEKIRYTRVPDGGWDRVVCEREFATAYSLSLLPLKSTGYGGTDYHGQPNGKPTTLWLVKNIIKVDPALAALVGPSA